jgi:D-amino-acid dehydrogenase
MAKGYRITTGIEFGHRDAAPTPVQLQKARAKAEDLFPLQEAVEEVPWLGRRPCLPDSKPILGAAPGHPGLWLCFGHAHLGFTLGPVGGELMAQMIAGETPLADPAPFSPERFGRA